MRALLLLLALAVACGGDASRYDPPADHTVSKDGARHMPGLHSPLTECVSCHGADLKGGDTQAGHSGVSCFECHGKKW